MSDKVCTINNFKDFNFSLFLTSLAPKLSSVVNANCKFDYQDVSNTYKKILSEIGVENINYNNFRKALLNYFKERESSYCTLEFAYKNGIGSPYQEPRKTTILDKVNLKFVLAYGFFVGIDNKQFVDIIKHLYVSSIAHGCRFIPTDTTVELDLNTVQFESFVSYIPYVEQLNYSKIQPVINSKYWYKFLECKLDFDRCLEKYKHMIEKYVIKDQELLSTRKDLIFQILNQNGQINVTNSYLESSINSINYQGISLFELSILQTLTVGSLKYDPHGSQLIGEENHIHKFRTMAKKRRPIQVVKKLAEICVILGYNAVVLEPSDDDIQDVINLIHSYIKHYNEIKYNLDEYIFLILTIGIDNAKIDIKQSENPNLFDPKNFNPKSMFKV
jgi:hypothetical protein